MTEYSLETEDKIINEISQGFRAITSAMKRLRKIHPGACFYLVNGSIYIMRSDACDPHNGRNPNDILLVMPLPYADGGDW